MASEKQEKKLSKKQIALLMGLVDRNFHCVINLFQRHEIGGCHESTLRGLIGRGIIGRCVFMCDEETLSGEKPRLAFVWMYWVTDAGRAEIDRIEKTAGCEF